MVLKWIEHFGLLSVNKRWAPFPLVVALCITANSMPHWIIRRARREPTHREQADNQDHDKDDLAQVNHADFPNGFGASGQKRETQISRSCGAFSIAASIPCRKNIAAIFLDASTWA